MVQVRQDFKSISFKGFSRCLAFFWKFDILVNHLSINNTRTPFVSRKRRSKSTMVSPFQCMTRFGFSVTVATTTASIFSCYMLQRRHLHLLDEPLQPSVPEIQRWQFLYRSSLGISMVLCLDQFQDHLPIHR